MNNNYSYIVIGGQYETVCYGGSDTLTGAKRLASKNAEYWDNWQGWHVPSVYRAEDVRELESSGRITTPDGVSIVVPREGAMPCAVAQYINGRARWEDVD